MKPQNPLWCRPAVAYSTAALCCLLWGSAFPLVKIGFSLFSLSADDTPSMFVFAGTRFALAGALLLVFATLREKKLPHISAVTLRKSAGIGLFQTVLQYAFYYVGLAHTSGVRAAVIVGSNVFSVVLLSCLLFRLERLTVKKLLGCAVGFCGVLVLQLRGGGIGGGVTLLGDGFMLLSTILYAVSPALMKLWSPGENVVLLSGLQFLLGGIVLALGGFFTGGHIGVLSPRSCAVLVYLSLVSAVAYTLWAQLLKYNPVSKITVCGFLNPVCGALLSALLLGEAAEAFRPESLLALLLVSAGIILVNRHKTGAASD